MKKPPAYTFALSLVLGFLAAAAPATFPFADQFFLALLASTVVFGVAGSLCGGIWPEMGWRWGIWIAAPGFIIVSLGVLTSGDWTRFLTDDLPFIVSGLLGAAAGAAAASTLRSRGSRNDVDRPASRH